MNASITTTLYDCLQTVVGEKNSFYDECKKELNREFAHADTQKISTLRPVRFTLDCQRLFIHINDSTYPIGCTNQRAALIESQITTLLFQALGSRFDEKCRERKIHKLRYQLQSLMHQGIYSLHRTFCEEYLTKYADKGQLLAVLDDAKESYLKLHITSEFIAFYAINYWKVVDMSKPTEAVGFEAIKVTIFHSLDQLDCQDLFLSKTASPNAIVSYHGITSTLDEITF